MDHLQKAAATGPGQTASTGALALNDDTRHTAVAGINYCWMAGQDFL